MTKQRSIDTAILSGNGTFITIGTITPRAPASRAYLICQLVLPETPVAGILIIGVTPALSIALTLSAAPGTSGTVPCSQSTTIHDKWGLDPARVRACKSPGSVNQAPKAGLDDRRAFRRGWVVMDNRKSSSFSFLSSYFPSMIHVTNHRGLFSAGGPATTYDCSRARNSLVVLNTSRRVLVSPWPQELKMR